MPDEIDPSVALYVAERVREAEEKARGDAEKARNQAIGVLGFVALLLGIMASLGLPGLLEEYAKTQAKLAVDAALGEPVMDEIEARRAKLAKAGEEAQKELDRLQGYSHEGERLRDQLRAGQLAGDLRADGNRWGKCEWRKLDLRQAGYVKEDIGFKAEPKFGCPNGTFMTHVDHDHLGQDKGWAVMNMRCCQM